MNYVLDFFLLVSICAWIIRLRVTGLISNEMAVGALVASVIVVGIARRMKMTVAGVLWRIGLPVVSMIGIAMSYGGGNTQQTVQIAAALAALVIALFGIYIMVRG